MAKKIQSTQAKHGLPMGAKAAIAVGAMGVATLFGACDNGTSSTPKVCECPNGTVHNNFGCECGGEGCTCTHTLYHLNYGMTLEDQTGGSLTSAHINLVNSSLDEAKTYEGSLMDDVISTHNIKIIIISGASYSRNGDDFTIGIGNLVDLDHINTVLITFLYQVISFNNSNSNIRFANGRILNVGKAIALGRQFSDAKQIVRAAFQSQRQA
jgi:hypothetical protein